MIARVRPENVEYNHIYIGYSVYREDEYTRIPYTNFYLLHKSKLDKELDNRLQIGFWWEIKRMFKYKMDETDWI